MESALISGNFRESVLQLNTGEATLVAGSGSMSLKNNANNVSLDLASQTTGIALGISGQGLTIDMPEPPLNAPRVYVLEFGFNKDFVNARTPAKR
jgi:hypothetical protein